MDINSVIGGTIASNIESCIKRQLNAFDLQIKTPPYDIANRIVLEIEERK